MNEAPDPFVQQRLLMVEEQLKRRGIRSPRVLEAFRKVPRHLFVPEEMRKAAYQDGPLPIGESQTISQPYMVAVMTDAADIAAGARVLEIGTGSGYQLAVLAEIAGEVFSVERRPDLAQRAMDTLHRLGYHNVQIRVANGTLGWPEQAPFNAIIVTAGAPAIPQPLKEQLALEGRLVIPVEEGVSQVLYTVIRTRAGFLERRGERCAFVPLIGEFGWGE